MAIGTITMILANVGLQIYNNWCGSRQNCELQQKREEFERAARERNTEHMWRLLREGQALALQLEAEKHNDRLNELKVEIDNLLQKLTYETAIINWPLKVLPIVMKNQALGNMLAKQEESIALHVIFTRSNYDQFNKSLFHIIEKELELYSDKYWSTMSNHPLLFYSGAWIPQSCPTDVQIDSMRTALSNLPTLLITPFFRPNDGRLVFQVHIWGVGASSTARFDVQEIVPNDFQRIFTNQDDYYNEEGLMEEIIEDIIPYLECLIGYVADNYFWSSSGIAPQLPSLISNGTIYTDGMKYLVSDCREYYDKLLLTGEKKAKENPFAQNNLINLYDGCAELWDEDIKKINLENIISLYNSRVLGNENNSFNNTLLSKNYLFHDLPFLVLIKKYSFLIDTKTRDLLDDEIERLYHNEPKLYTRDSFPRYLMQEYSEQDLDFENVLLSFVEYCNRMDLKGLSILICFINPNEYHFHTYDDVKDVILYFDNPFNICYKTKTVKRQRNINNLFSNSKTKQISCQLHRIKYLIERINSNVLNY